MTRRIGDLVSDISLQLEEKARNFTHFSLAFDESENISYTVQLIICIRRINQNFEICEKLAALNSSKNTAAGEKILLNVIETIDNPELNWENLFV